MSNEIIKQDNSIIVHEQFIQEALELLLYSLSDRSRRQYQHTYHEWGAFCQERNIPYHDMTAKNLIAFLESMDIAHSTKQARLTHIRRLLQTLHSGDPDNVAIKRMYEQAKILKVNRDVSKDTAERPTYALSKKEVYDAFAVWGDDSKLHIRNRALLAILFYAGLRRAEAASLEWRDIDLKQGLVTVRHGKGNKSRTIPILGDNTPLEYLTAWHKLTDNRRYVFCGLLKGNKLGKDKPLTTQMIYYILRDTGDALGKEGFSPHDTRRTLLTSMLKSGTPLHYAQEQAGHKRGDTTLRYAKVKDAEDIRAHSKIEY